MTNSNIFIHESSFIDEPSNIGEGTKIWHYCHVMPNAKIGNNCVLGQNVFVGSTAVLGNNVHVQNNVSIYDDVILQDDTFCGPSMVFTNVINPRSFINRKSEYKKTIVKKGATIGANATIVCGNTIGEYAFVGAGSVVTKDIPAYAQVVGVPAQIISYRCKCGEALNLDEIPIIRSVKCKCESCNTSYKGEKGILNLE